jgi:hypothetical protein
MKGAASRLSSAARSPPTRLHLRWRLRRDWQQWASARNSRSCTSVAQQSWRGKVHHAEELVKVVAHRRAYEEHTPPCAQRAQRGECFGTTGACEVVRLVAYPASLARRRPPQRRRRAAFRMTALAAAIAAGLGVWWPSPPLHRVPPLRRRRSAAPARPGAWRLATWLFRLSISPPTSRGKATTGAAQRGYAAAGRRLPQQRPDQCQHLQRLTYTRSICQQAAARAEARLRHSPHRT